MGIHCSGDERLSPKIGDHGRFSRHSTPPGVGGERASFPRHPSPIGPNLNLLKTREPSHYGSHDVGRARPAHERLPVQAGAASGSNSPLWNSISRGGATSEDAAPRPASRAVMPSTVCVPSIRRSASTRP